jgi:hypothetical protein
VNSSDNACDYEVDLTINDDEDADIFYGHRKFTVKPKDIFSYQFQFSPKAEKFYEGSLTIHNLTEGIYSKYILNGKGERPPILADIKINTKVGEM